MPEGANQSARDNYVNQFVGGTVHLLNSLNAVNDGDTIINSNASATTATGDWAVTHNNADGTTKLENAAAIDFGSPSGFVVDQIVIESPNDSTEFIIDNSPSGDTDLSGDGSTSIPSGSLSYTFGGE